MAQSAKDSSKLTAQSFYVDHPLYEVIPDSTEMRTALDEIIHWAGTIDAYCVYCQRESVFRGDGPGARQIESNIMARREGQKVYAGLVTRTFRCQRTFWHQLVVFLLDAATGLQKVGQYPSVADIQKPELQKYRKILGDERFKELNRGVGLSAHGIGIGAFVYLRRIFESLIEETHGDALKLPGWNETEYIKSRMAERIQMLKDRLPQFLVDNAGLYSILSTGVHELTESDCLQHYDAVRMGIEIILDQHLAAQERAEKIAKATAKIQTAHQTLAAPKGDPD